MTIIVLNIGILERYTIKKPLLKTGITWQFNPGKKYAYIPSARPEREKSEVDYKELR